MTTPQTTWRELFETGGLALAIILRVFRARATANVDEVDALKW